MHRAVYHNVNQGQNETTIKMYEGLEKRKLGAIAAVLVMVLTLLPNALGATVCV